MFPHEISTPKLCHPGIRLIYTKLKKKKQQHTLCYSNFQVHMKKNGKMNSQGFITQFKTFLSINTL